MQHIVYTVMHSRCWDICDVCRDYADCIYMHLLF